MLLELAACLPFLPPKIEAIIDNTHPQRKEIPIELQNTRIGLLLGRKCKVRIDDSFLPGGERCSTTIFVS